MNESGKPGGVLPWWTGIVFLAIAILAESFNLIQVDCPNCNGLGFKIRGDGSDFWAYSNVVCSSCREGRVTLLHGIGIRINRGP